MDDQLKTVLADYQYKHFAVDWDTHVTSNTQVRDLANVINDFLDDRVYVWDVVVIGHSRGGIFAHDLTRYLVGNAKIGNLHTYLLDPTASAIPLNDLYPRYKYEKSPTIHYANLYYDGDEIIDGVAQIGTVSDQDILGYDTYVFDSSHIAFGINWVENADFGFGKALSDIKGAKNIGAFDVDGNSGMEIVKLSRPDGLDFDGEVTIVDGNLVVHGALSFQGFPLHDISIDVSAGQDGLELASATGVALSHIIIKSDLASVSLNALVSSYTASISNEGIFIEETSLNVTVSTFINQSEANVTLDVGPAEVSYSTHPLALVLGIPAIPRFSWHGW